MMLQDSCSQPDAVHQVPGLFYVPELLSEEEATALLAAVDAGPLGEVEPTKFSSGRPVVTHPGIHWHGFTAAAVAGSSRGSRSRMRVNKLLPDAEVTEWFHNTSEVSKVMDLPQDTSDVVLHARAALNRLRDRQLVPEGYCFDQAIINNYSDGKGIAAHVDRATFDDLIVGLSLGAPTVLHFTQAGKKNKNKSVPTEYPNGVSAPCSSATVEPGRFELLLEPRSAYVMSGEARWRWCHGIPDGVPTISGVQLPVGRRVSVTFRRLRWRHSMTGKPEIAAMVDEHARTGDGRITH